jgi:hypothetical protein
VSDIINFLEQMGQDARLRYATMSELREALIAAGVSPAAMSAILAGDERLLEARVGASGTVCCLVYQPREPARKREDDGDTDDAEDADDTKAQSCAVRLALQEI